MSLPSWTTKDIYIYINQKNNSPSDVVWFCAVTNSFPTWEICISEVTCGPRKRHGATGLEEFEAKGEGFVGLGSFLMET